MKIKLRIDSLLVGNHVFRKGDVIDLEAPGDHKKYLVEGGYAEWIEENGDESRTADLPIATNSETPEGKRGRNRK